MKAKVDPKRCALSGLCVETCPQVFQLGRDSAVVKVPVVPKEAEKACREARDNCPTEAISIEG